MWCLRCLFSVILLAASAFAATQPNVLLITIDTTRADRMGFLGSKRGLTPNLDVLAKQGIVFGRAYSQYPLTVPSHATILSGTYPQFHKVIDFGLPLAKSVPYLPDILHQHGYQTGAFVAAAVLDPDGGWVPGFGRGFDEYETDFRAHGSQPSRYETVEHRADYVVAHALAWLKDHPQRPFFAWIHMYDPHEPYEPPERFKTRYAAEPYDGEIAFADSELGKLFSELRARGLYDDTLIAVMSDHGEAFGEHGEFTHGIFLYDETVHVPLLVRMPANRFAGQRVDARVGLVDVVPTVLEAVGIPIPPEVQGDSLVPLMKSPVGSNPALAKLENRPAYSESDYPHRDFGWSSLRALREGKYLFVEAPHQELYDQSADPVAGHNLAPSAPAVTQALSGKLATFRQKTASSASLVNPDVDPKLVQQLAALGYVSGASAEPPGREMTGADPKDKIAVFNQVEQALLAGGEGRSEDEIRILEKMQQIDPNVEIVCKTLGDTYLRIEEYDKARPLLRKVADMRPNSSQAHYQLGQALLHLGDLENAKSELQTAIAKSNLLNLKYAAALHFFLASIYQKTGESAELFKELRLADQLDPDNYTTILTLGRLLALDGDAKTGLPYLLRAAKLEPNSIEPHGFLADAYTQLGRTIEATVQQREVERLQAIQNPEPTPPQP